MSRPRWRPSASARRRAAAARTCRRRRSATHAALSALVRRPERGAQDRLLGQTRRPRSPPRPGRRRAPAPGRRDARARGSRSNRTGPRRRRRHRRGSAGRARAWCRRRCRGSDRRAAGRGFRRAAIWRWRSSAGCRRRRRRPRVHSARRSTSTRSNTRVHRRASRRASSMRPARAKRSITGSEALCLPVELQEQRLGLAVLRHQADADIGAHRVGGRGDDDRLGRRRAGRRSADPPCRSRRGTDRAGPCPASPATPRISPGAQSERGVLQLADRARGRSAPEHLGARRARRRRGRGGKACASERPTIMRDHLVVVEVGDRRRSRYAGRCAAPSCVSQNARTSRRRWEMKTIVTPSRARAGDDVAQPVDVAAGERRGRLVEQQDARLAEDARGRSRSSAAPRDRGRRSRSSRSMSARPSACEMLADRRSRAARRRIGPKRPDRRRRAAACCRAR